MRLWGTQGRRQHMLRRTLRVDSAACVRFSCFVSCHNLRSCHTNEERRINTMSGATGSQKQLSHSRSSEQSIYIPGGVVHNQPWRYTTAVSGALPNSCLCDSYGDYSYVRVVCVYTECTAVLMYQVCTIYMGWELYQCCALPVC